MKSLVAAFVAFIATIAICIVTNTTKAYGKENEFYKTQEYSPDQTYLSSDIADTLDKQKGHEESSDTSRMPYALGVEEYELGSYPQLGASIGASWSNMQFNGINTAFNTYNSSFINKGYYNFPIIDYKPSLVFLFSIACRISPRIHFEFEAASGIGYTSLDINATYRFPIIKHSGLYPFFKLGFGYYYFTFNQTSIIDSANNNDAQLTDSTHGGSFGGLAGAGIEYNFTSAFSFDLFLNYTYVPQIHGTADDGEPVTENLSGIVVGARFKLFFQ